MGPAKLKNMLCSSIPSILIEIPLIPIRNHETVIDSNCDLGIMFHCPGCFTGFSECWRRLWKIMDSTAWNATQCTENKTSLWSWGNAPKGYTIYNGKPIPPGSGPQWYYPSPTTNNTPIITNSTALNSMYQDPWVLAEFTGRPVMIINSSAGPLF
jgi:hypothetical protein